MKHLVGILVDPYRKIQNMRTRSKAAHPISEPRASKAPILIMNHRSARKTSETQPHSRPPTPPRCCDPLPTAGPARPPRDEKPQACGPGLQRARSVPDKPGSLRASESPADSRAPLPHTQTPRPRRQSAPARPGASDGRKRRSRVRNSAGGTRMEGLGWRDSDGGHPRG